MTVINNIAQKKILEDVVRNFNHEQFEALINWGGELYQDGIVRGFKIGRHRGIILGAIGAAVVYNIALILYFKYKEDNDEPESNVENS